MRNQKEEPELKFQAGGSYDYLEFMRIAAAAGVSEPTQTIDNVYRYWDGQNERFFYHKTMTLSTLIGEVTSYVPNVGNSKNYPTNDDFLWNERNLAKISKFLTPHTNFTIYTGNGTTHSSVRSAISREVFLREKRETILALLKTSGRNDLDVILAAVRQPKETQAESQKLVTKEKASFAKPSV